MTRWRSFAVKYIPFWLLLLSPLFLFPGRVKVLVLLALPVFCVLNKFETGHFIRRTPFDWVVFLLLVMVLVTEYATFDLNFTLPKLSGLLFHITIFYVVVEVVRTRQGLKHSLILFFLLGIIVSIVGLLGTDWLFKNEVISNFLRKLPKVIQGLPGAETGIGPNELAGTLLWFFPLAFGILMGKKNDEFYNGRFNLRAFLWLTFGVTIFVFVLTQSRGGWIGGVVALVFIGAVLNKTVRWLAGGATIALLGAVNYVGISTVKNLLVSDTVEGMVGNLGSLGFRMEVWRAAIWGIRDFPFTGMGLGTFRRVARVLYPMNVSPTFEVPHAHQQFLQVAVDLGIPGLVAYIALWIGVAYLLWYTWHTTTDGFIKSVTLGVSGSLLGFFMFGITDTIALGAKPGLFLWWLFAFGVGVYQHTLMEERNHSENPHP